MKKHLLLLLILSNSMFGQSRKFISSPTVAYSNEEGTKAVGIFMRGAQLDKYEIINGYIYKIYTQHSDPLYITDNYNIKDHLSSNDEVGKTPTAISSEDDYYFGPHLFTNVAGLKIKAQPNLEAPVLGKLLNGTVIPIDYFPYAPDAWVQFEYQNKPAFVPIQYLGKRPILSELYTAYQNSTTSEDMKKYAERILELGWNSMPAENAEALEIYASYAEFVGNTSGARLCKLQAEVLKNIDKGSEEFIVEQLLDKKQFGFALNNQLEPANGFSLSFLEKNLGFITKSHSDLDDCALGDYENNVFFAEAECISHDINKTYTIRNLKIKGTKGFKIFDTFLDEHTTEEQFLQLTKKIVNYVDGKSSFYLIGTDGYAYQFQFINGKLSQIDLTYYC